MPLRAISLARTNDDKQREARAFDETPIEEVPDYPYGLEIYLTNTELAKLGFANGSLDAGDVVNLVGMARVKRVESESVNTAQQFRVTLQITDLGLEKESDSEDRANVIYGSPVSNAS